MILLGSLSQTSLQSAVKSPSVSVSALPHPHWPGSVLLASSTQPSRQSGVKSESVSRKSSDPSQISTASHAVSLSTSLHAETLTAEGALTTYSFIPSGADKTISDIEILKPAEDSVKLNVAKVPLPAGRVSPEKE